MFIILRKIAILKNSFTLSLTWVNPPAMGTKQRIFGVHKNCKGADIFAMHVPKEMQVAFINSFNVWTCESDYNKNEEQIYKCIVYKNK